MVVSLKTGFYYSTMKGSGGGHGTKSRGTYGHAGVQAFGERNMTGYFNGHHFLFRSQTVNWPADSPWAGNSAVAFGFLAWDAAKTQVK